MKVAVAAVAATIAGVLTSPVAAQEREEGLQRGVGYASATPLSPSRATSTVSPASVPQAMERVDADGADVDLSLGTIYSGGDFGTGSKTSIWNSALGARLHVRDLTLSASLPWMRIRSRSTFFTGIDATPVLVAPDTSSSKTTARGFGDVTLGASYTIAPDDLPLEVELSTRAKINTATNSSRLSSGANDYSVGTDVSLPLGHVTPFASFSYRFLGNTPVYDLRDGPAASAGASYALGARSFVLVSYHYSRAATRQVEDAHELFAGASTRIAASPLRVTGFVTAGLSQGASAASAGLALSVGLGRRGNLP